MSLTTLRRIARDLVKMRRYLIQSLLAELKGDTRTQRELEAHADAVWNSWPAGVQVLVRMDTRVLEPIQRKINREGILAQQGGTP